MAVKENKLSCNDLSLYNAYTPFDYREGVIYLNQSGIVRYNVYVLSPDALEEPESTNEEPEWDTSIPVSEREGYYLIYTGSWYVNKDYNDDNPILLDKLISIMRRRLSITMPDLTVGFDSGVTTDEYAYRRFCLTIFDRDFEDIYKYYHVLLSNDSEETFNNSHEFPFANKERIMTNAINGHADSRQFGFFTVYSTGDTVIAEDIAYKDFYCELIGSTEFDFSSHTREYGVVCTNFNAITADTDTSWISVVKTTTGITVTVDVNGTGEDREGSIKIYYPGADFEPTLIEIPVTQEREHFLIYFSGTSLYSATTQGGRITYSANTRPEVVSMPEWFNSAVVDPASNPQQGYIRFTFERNSGATSREGSIVLRRYGFASGETASCTIGQGVLDWEFELSQDSIEIEYLSGTTGVTYTANGPNEWLTVETPTWISASFISNTLLFEYERNRGYSARTGNIVVKSICPSEQILATLTVVQEEGRVGRYDYLTTTAQNSGTFKITGTNNTFDSRKNGGEWVSGNTVYVSSGDSVEWRTHLDSPPLYQFPQFKAEYCNFIVGGNPLSLWYKTGFGDIDSLVGTGVVPSGLFKNCTGLTNAEEMALPATAITGSAYLEMFMGCRNLVGAPQLPATVLGNECYERMFQGCTSLINAPQELPATNIPASAYTSMFSGCTSLVTSPMMPEIDEITLDSACCLTMFARCSSLVNPPALAATTLAPYCYDGMFYGCTSLKTAPQLRAPILVDFCYTDMFDGCSSLNDVTCMATTNVGTAATTTYWLRDVSQTGTFVKKANVSWVSGSSGIPSGWTVIEVA